ncbi:MAG: hypothetical protein WC921_03680 [Candidatus Paceibacterota bacterium]|jgi:hypothetical protein
MNKKFLIIGIIVVLILAIVGFVGYILNKGWKNFESKEYSFSFKYPADWTVEEGQDGLVILTSPDTEKIKKMTAGEKTDQISFLSHENEAYLISTLGLIDPIILSEEYLSSQEIKDRSNAYIGKLYIGGREAFQVRHSEYSDDKYTLIRNPDGSFFIVVQSLDYPNSSGSIKMEPYDTILSTLEFVK